MVTLLPETKLWPVSFNKRPQNEEAFLPESFMACACFPNVSQFPTRETLFPRSFPEGKLCSRYTAGNFNENPSMRAVAKILRERTIVREQFEQRPNFASTFKYHGTLLLRLKTLRRSKPPFKPLKGTTRSF